MNVPIPTPTSEVYEIVVDDLYQRAVTHYEAEDWENAIAVLTQLRTLDASYAAEAVEETNKTLAAAKLSTRVFITLPPIERCFGATELGSAFSCLSRPFTRIYPGPIEILRARKKKNLWNFS